MTSELVLHEVATGAEEVLLTTEQLIEAPNWAPCGTFFIVNGGGRIYRVERDAPALQVIDTGDCQACNNDHGVSPDGQTLVISQSPGRGTSVIYTLPIGGGTPRRVTPNAPSWWHGWSPDGARFCYTAKRGADFNIFTIPVTGGEETQLTFGPGHKDGPDYSADGAWIWYNSDHHGGTPELWRVPVAGGEPERMTDDDRVNWFPHPSPDGRHVLYLAYESDVTGHPRDCEVELRMIAPDGSDKRTVARLFGGQGTINVPCWSPDGTRFAYMRYGEGR